MRRAVSAERLANSLDDGLVEFLDHAEVDQRAGDVELQAELLAHFAGQPARSALLLTGPLHSPCELVVDDLLNTREPGGGAQILLDVWVSMLTRARHPGRA